MEGSSEAELVDHITIVSARFGHVTWHRSEPSTQQLNAHRNPIEASLVLSLGEEIELAILLVIVFLVLAAQYESWTLPGAVMTAVPFGILGALLTNWARGLTNDVYFQIGLLVLIGLGAKNAVLRVSAAVEFRKQGKSIMEATKLAGEQRLRPIIMTSLAFAMGCLPLALAVGAGANARHSIGTGIIGGMIGETTLAMLYVPLFFYLFDRLKERGETAPPPAAAPPVAARPTEAD